MSAHSPNTATLRTALEGVNAMTLQQNIFRPMVQDELKEIVSMLGARFPMRNLDDVEWLVTAVYRRLLGDARISAHLIPLTLNRCRRLLGEGWPSDVGSARAV